MTYLITFLEGVMSFLSPCMLPMLPVYLSFFAGGADKKKAGIGRILAFILGFTATFTLMGLFFSAVGSVLRKYQVAVNIVCGLLMILFGLSFLDVIRLPFLKGISSEVKITGVLSAFLFGVIYSINLTPCVGAFLGSALMLATASGSAGKGLALLLLYSLGQGIPFLLSALLVGRLDVLFKGIKKHYKIFNAVCGGFLILCGVLTACGLMERLIGVLT